MTYDLFHLTYDVASNLGLVKRGTATGGSTTTIADTNERTEADDFWNKGTAWILRNASSPGVAPEGEFSVISDFANTGGIVSLRSTLSQTVASGDTYAVAYKYVPLEIMIEKVNSALLDYGQILVVDTTSITIANDQTEYNLPTAAKKDLVRVSIETDKDDTNDQQWYEILNWKIDQSSVGTVATLILPEQYSAGYSIKLEYLAYHSALFQSTDQLNEQIPHEFVVAAAVRDCFQYRKDNTGWKDWDEQIARWTDRTEALRARKSMRYPTEPGQIVRAKRGQANRLWTVDMGSGPDLVIWG